MGHYQGEAGHNAPLAGHKPDNFDLGQGHTLLSKLCSRNEWTFEQDEYDLMRLCQKGDQKAFVCYSKKVRTNQAFIQTSLS